MPTLSAARESSAPQFDAALRRSLEAMEDALQRLEAKQGKVVVGDDGTVRTYSTHALRSVWGTWCLELDNHLEHERKLLPILLQGSDDEQLVLRGIQSLLVQHEQLLERGLDTRKAFLGVSPLRQVFARVEEALHHHVCEQEAGVFARRLDKLQVDFSETPTLRTYREDDPTDELRRNLDHAPEPEHEVRVNPLIAWFHQVMDRQPKVKW